MDAREGLNIGKNVNLSSNVSIYTLQHDHRDPYFGCPNPKDRKMSVEINDRAWLGSNVIVLPGVHIGEGAVCCAGCGTLCCCGWHSGKEGWRTAKSIKI